MIDVVGDGVLDVLFYNVMAHPRTPHRGMRIFPAEIFLFFVIRSVYSG